MAQYTGTTYNVLGNVIPNDHFAYKFYAEITYTQNVTNNTTTFTIKPYVYDSHGFNGTWYFKLDGSTYHTKVASTYGSNPDTVSGGTATKTVTHNADGTKTVTLNIGFETSQTQGANNNLNTYVVKSGTINATITLPTIPRASSISFSGDLTMGTAKSITISRASSSFTHTLSYNFGTASGTISSNATTSASWTPSKDLGEQIPNATSGVGTFTLKTYNGSTLIGTTTKTFTLWVSGDMYPTFTSLTLSGNNLSNDSYVQTVSSVTATIVGATGSYGSTISSYSITGHGLNVATSSGTSSVLNTSGNVTYTAKITDSRGRSATKTATIYVVPYQKPTISIRELYRCEANGNAHNEGTCVKLVVDYTYSDPNNTLTKKYDVKYKQTDTTTWTTAISNSSISSASGTITQIIQGIDVTKTYDISITIKDNYYESMATGGIGAATCLLNIEPEGIGVGKYHQNGVLDIVGDVYLDGKKMFETGTFNPSFYVSSGTTMMFTRRHGYYQKMGKWCMCNISLVVENFSGGSDSTYQFKVIELPFVNKGTYSAVTIGYCSGINTSYDIKAYIRPDANDIVFVARNGGSISTITGSMVSSTMDVQLSFIYQVEE